MVGDKYWTTGILLTPFRGKWTASLRFFDDGFCEDTSTEGTFTTRYFIELEIALDTLIKDAQTLGIEWRSKSLYAPEDGESKETPMPDGWEKLFEQQAKRVGFFSTYRQVTTGD